MTYTAIDPKFMQSLFMKNPFMSQWLSLANAAAGSARGFWMAEFSRQQAAMMSAMSREATRFWSSAWSTWPASVAQFPDRVAASTETAAAAMTQPTGRAMPAKVADTVVKATPRARPMPAKRAKPQPASAKRKSSHRR